MIGYKLTNCNEFVRECNFQMPKTHRNGCRICVSTSSMKIWHFPNSMASMLYLEEVGWQEKQPWDQSLSKVVKHIRFPLTWVLLIKWNRDLTNTIPKEGRYLFWSGNQWFLNPVFRWQDMCFSDKKKCVKWRNPCYSL